MCERYLIFLVFHCWIVIDPLRQNFSRPLILNRQTSSKQIYTDALLFLDPFFLIHTSSWTMNCVRVDDDDEWAYSFKVGRMTSARLCTRSLSKSSSVQHYSMRTVSSFDIFALETDSEKLFRFVARKISSGERERSVRIFHTNVSQSIIIVRTDLIWVTRHSVKYNHVRNRQ